MAYALPQLLTVRYGGPALTRDAAILSHVPLARAVARQLRRRLPWSLDPGDIEGEAFLALVRAVDDYRPELSRGVSLQLWIRYRVRGAVLDCYRGRANEWQQYEPLDPSTPDGQPGPEERYAQLELESRLAASLGDLSGTQRALLLSPEPVCRAGWRLGLGRTRAFEVRRQALRDLRRALTR